MSKTSEKTNLFEWKPFFSGSRGGIYITTTLPYFFAAARKLSLSGKTHPFPFEVKFFDPLSNDLNKIHLWLQKSSLGPRSRLSWVLLDIF